jgi:hypothetical protein
MPSREVEAWLAEQGEQITYRGLSRHKAAHMPVTELVKLHAQASPEVKSAVRKTMKAIEMVDLSAGSAAAVVEASEPVLLAGLRVGLSADGEGGAGVDQGVQTAWATANSQLLRCASVKDELENGKTVNLNGMGLMEFLGHAMQTKAAEPEPAKPPDEPEQVH